MKPRIILIFSLLFYMQCGSVTKYEARINKLNFKRLTRSIKNVDDITFIVSSDPQVQSNDPLFLIGRATSAMNRVRSSIGRNKNGKLIRGIWPYYTGDGEPTPFHDKGSRIHKPLFVIQPGDLTMNAKKKEWFKYRFFYENDFPATSRLSDKYRLSSRFRIRYPVFPGLGNHDVFSGTKRSFTYIKKRIGNISEPAFSYNDKSLGYSWSIGNFHFVQLHLFPQNSNGSMEWLKRELQKHRSKKIILIQHYGLDDFSTCYDTPFGFPNNRNSTDSCRWWTAYDIHNLGNLVKKHNVIAIFTGHLHMSGYCRWKFRNKSVPVFTAGGARDTDDFLLARLTKRYINVGAIRFYSKEPKDMEVMFSKFSMNEKLFDNDENCVFESQLPYSGRIKQK